MFWIPKLHIFTPLNFIFCELIYVPLYENQSYANEIINYIQLGINRELINVLKKNNIFEDLIFNSSGNIIINPDMKNDFQIKFEKLEDLHKFEITKYIMNYGE